MPTAGGTLVQLLLSFALALALIKISRPVRLVASTPLVVLLLFLSFVIRGLFLAIPMALLVAAVLLWLRFTESRPVPRRITTTLTTVWLAFHLVHLPIRFFLGQPQLRILGNVLAVLLGALVLLAYYEQRRHERRRSE